MNTGRTARILVVDDTEANRDLLARRLEREGHMADLAEDGEQAMAMMRANTYDAVLLDIMMPRMDGYQVLEAMQADPGLSRLPVIVISAVDEIESIVRCIRLGAEDYLPKPFNKDILHARINNCLNKHYYLEALEVEQKRTDALLRVILPDAIVDELKATNAVKPRRYDDVAVLFADIVGFTPYCEAHSAEHVVDGLQRLTIAFEEIAQRHGVQKIKTIGDAFMATAGLLDQQENPVLSCVAAGRDMNTVCATLDTGWQVRVGIHVGPVVAGVVGQRQYLFDLWGDTVNTAQRVEANGEPGTVHLSRAAWERLGGSEPGESRGSIALKGKGDMEIFRLL